SAQADPPWSPSLLHDLSLIPEVPGSPEVVRALVPDPALFREVWEKDAGADASGRSLKVARLARLSRNLPDPHCDTCRLSAETWSLAISPDGSVEKRLIEKD